MKQPRKWKSLGWEGSLLLVGVLAGGAFIAANSCDGSQTGGPGPGGLGEGHRHGRRRGDDRVRGR